MQKDWNALVARADEPDLPLTLMGGYDALIGRVRTLAEHPDLSARAKGNLAGLLEYHDKEAKARRMAQGWLADAERHVEAWKALERRSDGLGMPVARMDEYAGWREAARTLAATGRMILGDDESYGAHLAAVAAGRPRARLVVDQLREWIETPHNRVGEWLAVVGRHMEVRDALQDAAPDRRIHLTAMASYVEWREEAQRLVEEGEDILSERKASRTRPDDITPGERRMSAALSEFGATIGDDDREIAARKARQQRHWARERARLGFAEDMDVSAQADPAPPGIGDEGPERGVLWKLRRVYDWDGRMAERERQARIAAETDMSAERWQEYRRNWNRLLERAAEKGVHVIYMHGYPPSTAAVCLGFITNGSSGPAPVGKLALKRYPYRSGSTAHV